MKILHIIMTLLVPAFAGYLFAQDTANYSQENALMFSNNYLFVKKSAADKSGTFWHYSGSDDFNSWYGEGMFTESRHKIFLTYDTSNEHDRMETAFNTKHSDTLYIKWFDWWGEQQSWFTLRYADTTGTKNVYIPDFVNGFVKIARSDLQTEKLSLYAFGGDRLIFTFSFDSDVDEIDLFVNDPLLMHTFTKPGQVLKKNRKGFRAKGRWTVKRRVQFVKVK